MISLIQQIYGFITMRETLRLVSTSYTGGGSGGFPAAVSSMDFAILLIAIMIWLFSLFFLYRSIEMQKWIFKDTEGAPNPEAGELTSLMISALIIVVWFLRTIILTGRFEIFDFIYYPKGYAPAFLLSSFYPAAVGLFKALTVVATLPKVPTKDDSVKFLWTPVVYLLIGFTNFTASIVTLIKALRP